MPIKVACACGKKLAVKDELAGKKVKCPACQKLLSIPKPKVQEESLDDEWDLGDSAEQDFEDEPSDAPVKSRGGKSSASRGAVSRKSSVKGKGKKSKSSNRGLLIGLSAGGGVLVVALLTWMLWPAAPADNVADNPPANQEQTPVPASGDTVKPTNSAPQVADGVQKTLILRGHTREVTSVAFSPDGKLLAVTDDKAVKVWDTASGQEKLVLNGHTIQILSVAFSPDGKRLASGGFDKSVKIWDATSGQETLTLNGHNAPIYSVAFSPDGKRLASGGSEATIKVWDTTSGQETLTLPVAAGGTGCVAFSPDGTRLASASFDTVKVWDTTNGQEIFTLKGHTKMVTSVAFSPDGKRLASGGNDKTVKVWDVTSGQETLMLKGNTGGSVNGVAFSPDGKRLAATAGGGVKVWDATNGQEMPLMAALIPGARCVAFSPDGKRLASGSSNRTAQVWDVLNPPTVTGTMKIAVTNAQAKDAEADLKALQGVWQLSDIETWRANRPPLSAAELAQLKQMVVTIKGDTLTSASFTGNMATSIQIDPTQKPKAIDLTLPDGPLKGAILLGIYSIDGDTWKWCMSPSEVRRPSELKPDEAFELQVMVFQRVGAAGLANAPIPEDKFDHKAWERVKPTLAQIGIQGQLLTRREAPESIPEELQTVAVLVLPKLPAGDAYPDNIFATIKSLSHVVLKTLEMSDAKLQQLSEHPGLIGLNLSGKSAITANGLAHLKRCPLFRHLFLEQVSVTPDLLKVIGDFSNLTSLSLNDMPVTDDLLSNLLALKKLDTLSLQNTSVTDAGTAQLAKLSSLKTLFLEGSKVTDQGLPSLKSLSKLTMLSVRKLNVSPQAVDELQKALPNCKILK